MTAQLDRYNQITTILKQRLGQLGTTFRQAGDEQSALGIDALIHKLTQQQLSVAFCGHISGGKSALINALIGDDILPTSPIPSSANIVTLQSGPASARVFLKDGGPIDFDLFSNLTDVQSHCLDGIETHSVAITVPHDLFDASVSLVDTPGIDSIEKAKHLAREPAIVAADVIFYVMDYNHVQSEINFSFTKQMKERGKPVFLVVNQIDKHCDFELDFSYFKRSSQAGFAAWDIRPNGLYFTSLTELNHPENQLSVLKQHVQSLFKQKDEILAASVLSSAIQLIHDHCRHQAAQKAEQRQQYQNVIDQTENLEEALQTYRQLQQQIDELRRLPRQLQEALDKEINTVVENARITTFSTTKLAEQYIESRSPGFKVGFFFSGDKTKKEVEHRLQAIFADFSQQVSTQLEWHLRDVLAKVPESYGIATSDYLQTANAFSVSWGPELISQAVRDGAVPSNEYIHNFTKDISSEAKGLYRRAAFGVAEQAVALAQESIRQKLNHLNSQLEPLSSLMQAITGLEKLDQTERQYRDNLVSHLRQDLPKLQPVDAIVNAPIHGDAIPEQTLEGSLKSLGNAIKDNASLALSSETTDTALAQVGVGKKATQPPREAIGETGTHHAKAALQKTAQILNTYASSIGPLPGFKHMAEALTLRAERLEKNIFTVALFGAFSAGKSSVANALMGNMVLPVSPNPTTAAINKILPPNDTYPHGTVRVQLKTKADIQTDVINSLHACDVSASTLDEALQRIQKISPGDIHPTAKPHYSFLQAVAKGIGSIKDHLGQELIIDLDTFNDYVASEEKACFVEWIELYYSCPLTNHGIMLVDTPGADSINARHTGVAFDYIKNADAVFFVTYYNSAFSHADRDFLFQLGRVKDSFAMDKMFFLVNAADLAKTAPELDEVLKHVEDSVAACGIRNPRIYPVSSQTALLARLAAFGALTPSFEKTYRQRTASLLETRGLQGQISERQSQTEGLTQDLLPWNKALELSGFAQFEEAFFHFTLDDLTSVAIQAAQSEMRRCLISLDEVIETAKSDANSRLIKSAAYEASRSELHRTINGLSTAADQNLLDQEVDELVYYVKQRLFFRFGDIFNRYFNPAVLQDAQGSFTKKAAHHSLENLIQTMENELAQEMRATSLRIENFINRRGEQFLGKLEEAVETIAAKCKLQAFEPVTLPTPDFPRELLIQKASSVFFLLSLIKNAREFFEGSGRANFRNELEAKLQTPVDEYVSVATDILRSNFTHGLTKVLTKIRAQVLQEVDDYYEGLTAALAADFDVALAESIRDSLVKVGE